MLGKILTVAVLVLVPLGHDAAAQDGRDHKFEVIPYFGGVWSRGRDVLYGGRVGTLRTDSAVMGGVAVDYRLATQYTWLEFLYSRENTKMKFELAEQTEDIGDVGIEYYQIGGVFGVERKHAVWYTVFSLGATRYAGKETLSGDEWRFSIGFGLGAKYYFNERIGLRIQFQGPYTFTGGDQTEFICLADECVKNGGGRGLWQFNTSVGLIVRL
ncbi:MAG: hypothetical protein P8181_07225 [bacterium]